MEVQIGVTVPAQSSEHGLKLALNFVLHIYRKSCLGKANTRSPFPVKQRHPSIPSVGPESSTRLLQAGLEGVRSENRCSQHKAEQTVSPCTAALFVR